MMEVNEHLRHIDAQAALLVAAANHHGPDASIPTCPGWAMRDLVHHLGGVHRWAAGRITSPDLEPASNDLEEFSGGWPTDESLIDWFNAGAAGIVNAIREAPLDLKAMTFIPSSSPRQFWARRQAMEISIHRADAESAGGTFTAFETELALDGIDELVNGFATRPMKRYRSETAHSMHLVPTDAHMNWLVSMGPDGITTAVNPEPRITADVTVSASASDLFLFVWNRLETTDVRVEGDPAAFELWSRLSRVGW